MKNLNRKLTNKIINYLYHKIKIKNKKMKTKVKSLMQEYI